MLNGAVSVSFFFLCFSRAGILMASLDEIWARFSLTEEEEGGAEVPKDAEESVYRLAGRFYTKRVLNVDAVARTFKPLWENNR